MTNITEITENYTLKNEIKTRCTIHGDFILSSGTKSNIYFDKYLFESDPVLLEQICIELSKFWVFPHNEFDFIAGLETGGIPLAVMLSHVTKIPTLFVRKEAKKYGTCNIVEGGNIVGKRLLVVEDIVTSGKQVMSSCEKLEESGAIISNVCCVIVRNNTGKQLIESKYSFSALFNFVNDAI